MVASARGEWVDPTLSNADQMRTKRRPDRSNQAALPLDNLPEQAAGWVVAAINHSEAHVAAYGPQRNEDTRSGIAARSAALI